MLALSKKYTLLLILVAALVVLAVAFSVLHAMNPLVWQHFADSFVPQVWSRY